MSSTKNIIRNIYLYIVTLIGLVMLVIALVDLIQLGLKTWIFTLADQQDTYQSIPTTPYGIKNISTTNLQNATSTNLTIEDRQAFEQWKNDYQNWETNTKNIDQKKAQKQRDAVRDIALLIVGLGLFLSHGYVVRKDRKLELQNVN